MELVGSNIGFRQRIKNVITTFNNKISLERWGNSLFYPLGMFNNSEQNYLNDALEVPELNAILSIRARAMSMAKFIIVNKATGKEVTNNTPLANILRHPNWFQGSNEFWRQLSLYRDIYGNAYIFFLTPFAMSQNFKGMFNLNPANVDVEYSKDGFYFLKDKAPDIKYVYIENNKKITIEPENIIHINESRITDKDLLKGTSKLKALKQPLDNIRDAYRKRNIILNMPVGILNPSNTDGTGVSIMQPAEKENLQLEFSKYGINHDQYANIISTVGLNYNAFTISARGVGLFEEVKEDTLKICDSYGVPAELIGSDKGTTFANREMAEKWFYQNTIMPDVQEIVDSYNLFLETQGKSWELIADWSHLHVFDENIKDRATTLNTLITALNSGVESGLLTPEQAQAELKKLKI